MRLFLIIANFVFLFALISLFRQELRVSHVDATGIVIFAMAASLSCLNVGYIMTTRTDKSVIARGWRFVHLWRRSADPT